MAEMTAEEAINLLNSIQLTSESNGRKVKICVLIYESEAYPISALIQQQAQQIKKINSLLPDNYSESKDWQAGDAIERIEWLKGMYDNKKAEIEQLEKLIQQQAEAIEAQKREIETQSQAKVELLLRLNIDAMRNLTSEQIDEVCQRIIAGQVKEGQ